ncbi:NAD(P)H-hydrate dehydratase [Corynebacterium macginleyi]
MRPAFSVSAVRSAESALLAQQSHDDELMRLAARGVAATAKSMLPGPELRHITVLAGPGGNGGDGLYAGAFLAAEGYGVDAILVADTAHGPALQAFTAAGGTITKQPRVESTGLLIDAAAGLNSTRGLSGTSLAAYRAAKQHDIPILSVDIPSGINADTGVAADNAVAATVTVSFGWARAGHIFAPECGTVVLCDLHLPHAPRSFAEELTATAEPAGYIANEPTIDLPFQWPTEPVLADAHLGHVTAPKPVGCTGPIVNPTPHASSTKYTGGVTAICAGSSAYPGAGILAATGAVRATPSMVRVIDNDAVVPHLPEVVAHPSAEDKVHAQAWVVGPGRGTDDAAARELQAVLDRELPTILDADALTLLAQSTELRDRVRAHPRIILTPHAGEFRRLYEATFDRELDLSEGVGPRQRELAEDLDCFVLHKGRITTVTAPNQPIYGMNAGHSYAATAGSGDVLSGILGTTIAQVDLEKADAEYIIMEILHAAALHQHAAAIAAHTTDGFGICSASQIAAAIPQSIARLLVMHR